MINKNLKRTLALVLAMLLLWATLPMGALAYSSNNGEVDSWNVRSDGSNVVISFSGVTDLYYRCFDCHVSGDLSGNFQFIYSNQGSSVKFDWNDIPGSAINFDMADGGAYNATVSIPLSFFNGTNFTLNFCGASVPSSDFLGSTTVQPEPEPTPEPTESEPVESEPTESEPTESEPVESEPESTPEPAKPVGGASVQGKIVVDGDLSDWINVPGYTDPKGDYSQWKVAFDEAGNLYFCATYQAKSEWDSADSKGLLNITQNGATRDFQFGSLHESYNIPGSEYVLKNTANGNSAAPGYVEVKIPASYLTDPNFMIGLNGDSIPASSIPVVNGQEPAPPEDAVYEGIVIDGEFHDWDAVSKHPAAEPHGWLDSAAMVFDGDTVYIYIKEAPGGDASNCGTHQNGQYAIVTDLNKTLLVQLNQDGTVSGIEGATASHVGAQWEIAIPASALPEYLESLSFGLYMLRPFFLEGVTNLDGSTSGGSFDGIVYDGNYRDWDYYPHTLIEYDTPGTQEHVVDGEGALWSSNATLFGHVVTEHVDHLEEGGGEFAYAVSITFNGNRDYDPNSNFYPRLVAVDEAGNINWDPVFPLPNGTYEFYIASQDAWHTSTNINSLNDMDQLYGKMIMTIGDDKDECEFYLDLEMVAKKLGCDASDFKLIEAQFGRIGQQWISTAGSSSGALLGIGLSIVFAGGVLAWKKKKSGIAEAVAEG